MNPPQMFPPELYNFLAISLYTVNLFSIIIGMIIGLSNGFFRFRFWWIVVIYFALVAMFFAYYEEIKTAANMEFPQKFSCNITVNKSACKPIDFKNMTEADRIRLNQPWDRN